MTNFLSVIVIESCIADDDITKQIWTAWIGQRWNWLDLG